MYEVQVVDIIQQPHADNHYLSHAKASICTVLQEMVCIVVPRDPLVRAFEQRNTPRVTPPYR